MARGTPLSPFDWQVMNTTPETADNSATPGATVTDPDTDVFATHDFAMNLVSRITLCRFRLKYDQTAVTVNPVIQVWGQQPGSSIWNSLKSFAGAYEMTIAVDVGGDVKTSSYWYTLPISVPVSGYSIILLGIMTAYAGTGGTIANSTIEALAT